MGRAAMPSITGGYHIALTVSDADRSAEWYCSLLNMQWQKELLTRHHVHTNHRGRSLTAAQGAGRQVALGVTCRRVAHARWMSTAMAAARTAAPTAIRVISQPGMPPVATV
jgi:Glyoxalase/Bleomycin resistance protein/Dioxygenase superfamily